MSTETLKATDNKSSAPVRRRNGSPFFQPKLTINQPGDEYEREADATADRVMRMSTGEVNENSFFKPVPQNIQRVSDDEKKKLHRACANCEEKEKMHRKESSFAKASADKNSSGEISAGARTESYLSSIQSSGSSLPSSTKSFFAPRFGYDFSSVKIHTDSRAHESARNVNALAYTHGNNIVFGANQFSPESDGGKKLLAHELTHVVQQGNQYSQAGSIFMLLGKINVNSSMVYRTPQQPTLNEAKKTGTQLSRQSLSEMDVVTLFNMPSGERKKWYIEKLGEYENQLKESANNNVVPVQLLATVILNELADISLVDILQSDLAVEKGSLGIAQIQIDTAIKDNLFNDLTEAEGKLAYEEMVINPQRSWSGRLAGRIMQNPDREKRMAVNKRLQIPQYSIEAAAREIRSLLNQMMANLGSDWQTRSGFIHKGITAPLSAQAIYNDVAGSNQRQKESNLSKLITGAYNSPGIINAVKSDETTFPNANIHGTNSRLIAEDLFDFKLFRP